MNVNFIFLKGIDLITNDLFIGDNWSLLCLFRFIPLFNGKKNKLFLLCVNKNYVNNFFLLHCCNKNLYFAKIIFVAIGHATLW